MIVPWTWLAFGGFVLAMLVVDAVFLHKRGRDPSMAESAATVGFWCFLATCVGGAVWYERGTAIGTQFFAGYVLEWSMSLDNIFVFAVLFRYFQVPKQYQHTVLFWGILGAVIMRLAFVLAGTALIARFHFFLPILGLFLLYTAFQFARHQEDDIDPHKNIVFRLARRFIRLAEPLGSNLAQLDAGQKPVFDADALYGRGFFVRQANGWAATGLFLVVIVVESTDLLFAVDSVPAVFGVTRDPFIVFASNILAILGLRALYFLLSGALDMFRYLHFGLAAILGFVGLKMTSEPVIEHFAGVGQELVPVWLSLVIIAGLLGTSIAASLLAGKKTR